MKLLRYRVKNFRSVYDTGWIDCQNVTVFAGENEAGKSNLLLALLRFMDQSKVNDPKAGEQIDSRLQARAKNFFRINAHKDVPIDRKDELMPTIEKVVFIEAEFEPTPEMNEYFKQLYPKYEPAETIVVSKNYGNKYKIEMLTRFPLVFRGKAKKYIISKIPRFAYFKEVTEVDSKIDLLRLALKLSGASQIELTAKEKMFANLLKCLNIWESNLIKSITATYDKLTVESKKEIDFRVIFEKVPMFLERIRKGFEYLNREFIKWWGKDDLTIGFEPYASGVLITVINKAGKKFLLENRSTGFRRFFALFLSFSVAATSDYANSILLFDEAGAALHPLVQRKLENFFNELGRTTQIMYNTHTAYMVSVKTLNRVRVVYKDDTNHTVISPTLRVNDDRSNEMSLYLVQSSLAQFVAEKALAGCLPIVVLNEPDQYYLSLIRNILVAKDRLNTVYDTLVFSTGANGIDAAAEAFSEADDMPAVILPSDDEGKRIKKRMLAGGYAKCPKKIFELSDFIPRARKFEDLIPVELVELFSRLYLHEILGKGFVYDRRKDLIGQIEGYAQLNDIELPENYRSEIAKRMKISTMTHFRNVSIKRSVLNDWLKIWKALLNA